MTREEAKQEIKKFESCLEYLRKALHGGYICPSCHSGEGKNKTGAVKYYPDTNTWACHACNTGGDSIQLYMITHGVDFNTALRELSQKHGITIDKNSASPYRQESASKQGAATMPKEQKPYYGEYYGECFARLEGALPYLASRGISRATAEKCFLGFDPAADTAQTGHPCPRLIIPVSESYYIARRTDGGETCKKLNPKGSTAEIFNAEVISKEGTVFIVEGAIDALSLIEIGEKAIALNSTSNSKKLLDLLSGPVKTKASFVVCLDNDDAGRKATDTLQTGFTRLNVPFVVANICGEAKDPNEALVKDRASFLSAVDNAAKLVTTKPHNTSLYLDLFMADDIQKFKQEIPTGFSDLDFQTGGLYAGLYVLAAISSLGKTSFSLQMAEQIAAGGRDVLFFSLEQSRFEMVAKGISRRTAIADMSKAVTSLSIRKGYLPAHVLEAAEKYKADVGDRLSVIEGNFDCDISFIADTVRQYIASNGVRPVVFVDYLQILQPTETKQSTKETVDKAVTELKRLSRELNIPVVTISSINRANYLTPVSFESLKESGGVEYTCDVVWGLQFQCLRDKSIFKNKGDVVQQRKRINEAKASTPRKIELSCLKNRFGVSSYSVYFDYFPAYDLFTTCEELDFEEEHEQKKAGVRA